MTRKLEELFDLDPAEEKKDISGSILLVDDSEDSRLLIKIFLKQTNITIDTAVNGVDGFKQYKKKNFNLF